MNQPDDTMQAMHKRFAYDNDIHPVRVLDFRADMEPGQNGAPPTYSNIEYKVQINGNPVWMPIAEWRDLVGMA
jgi:hypothetical protein